MADHPAVVVRGGADSAKHHASGAKRLFEERPDFVMPDGWTHRTFTEMEALSNRYANALTEVGITRGTRTLLMVRPGFDFVAVVFALFKMGAVPVMIDPGMGMGRLLGCIRDVRAGALVGIPAAQALRRVRPGAFASIEHAVTVGGQWGWGAPKLATIAKSASLQFDTIEPASHESAAVLFTSGSTGPAKGVVYEHATFNAQIHAIASCYDIQPGEIDLPTFPLFALFSLAMGMTAIIPDMDPSHPANADPARIIQTIRDFGVTSTFGSPALWRRVAQYGDKHNAKLPTLKRILIAGAPVPPGTLESLRRMLPDGADVHTPYGATESLPVSSISGGEVLESCAQRTRTGGGTCVGKPAPGIDLRIIRVTDAPIPDWSDVALVADGEIGEIVVAGDVVTREYFGLPEATTLAKIIEGERVWHRMGDVGYRDETGRVWFCGRKAHRVITREGTLYSVPCEAVFNEHSDVLRCALVGVGPVGAKTPVIVIEPEAGRFPSRGKKPAFVSELMEIARNHAHTRSIGRVLFHRALPVDVRHNAKINREALAQWARSRV